MDELQKYDTSMFDDLDAGDLLNKTNPEGVPATEMTQTQRFIIKNLFDTQPKKKKEYARQLGFELSKDGEEYRPIGQEFVAFNPVDPGIGAYFESGGMNELKQDVTDLTFDLGATGVAETAGLVQGAAGGAAIGSKLGPKGAVAGGVAGAMVGAGAGFVTSELLKDFLGDMVLDRDIPMDKKELFMGSLMSGGFAGMGKMAKYSMTFLNKKNLKGMKESFKEALKLTSNNKIDDGMIETIFAHPEKFTKEAVKEGTHNLVGVSKEIFGEQTKKVRSVWDIKGGIAKKKVDELGLQENKLYKQLADDPASDFDLDDLDELYKQTVSSWMNTAGPAGSAHVSKASSMLRKEIGRIRKSVRKKPKTKTTTVRDPHTGVGTKVVTQEPQEPVKISFEQMEFFKRNLQKLSYDSDTMGASQLATASGKARDMLRVKAQDIGAHEYLAIKDKQSLIAGAYRDLADVTNKNTLHKAYLLNDDVARETIRTQMLSLDDVLDTNFTSQLETGRLQQLVTQSYAKDAAILKGFKAATSEISKSVVRGAISGGATGTFVGQGKKAAMIGGSVAGFSKAKSILKKTNLEDDLMRLGKAEASDLATDTAESTFQNSVMRQATGSSALRDTRQEKEGIPDELDGLDMSAFDGMDMDKILNPPDEDEAF